LKKIVLTLFALLPCLLFSGCVDYKGLDETTIVTGISIDISDKNPKEYHIAVEILERSSSVEASAVSSKLIEAEGKSFFDTVYRMNKRLDGDLYFGTTGVIIINRRLAEKTGIRDILDSVLRDFDFRDSVAIIISMEDTAKELLEMKDKEEDISSHSISSILNKKKIYTNSVLKTAPFEFYNTIFEKTSSPMFPAFSIQKTDNSSEGVLTADGYAIFEEDYLDGFLHEKHSSSLLFATKKLNGGSYLFDISSEPDVENDYFSDATIIVNESKPRLDYKFDGKQFTLFIDVQIEATAIELPPGLLDTNRTELGNINRRANEALETEITAMVHDIQKNPGQDIFGFGQLVYHNNPDLFDKVRNDWNSYFSQAFVQVSCHFNIKDTSMTYTYQAPKHE